MALPKSMRLKGHNTFNYIHKNSVKYYGQLMNLKVVRSNPQILNKNKVSCSEDYFKIAIAISKKVSKKAVERNKIRRILHNYLLKIFKNQNNHKPYWILVNLKFGNYFNDNDKLLEEFHYLIYQTGVFK